MTEYSRFFGGDPAPEYTQPQFAEVLEKIFTNGIFTDVANELEVTETDPASMSVIVKSGEGWINGFWYQNTADLVKTIGAADPDNPRIDRIILRLDTVTNLKISIEVLEGTPAAEPTPPTLTQTANIYEISLAKVLVGATVTSIVNANITDEREYASVGDKYVTLTDIQTLTNKTLTKPVINAHYDTPQTYTPAAGGTATLDLGLSNEHKITMPAGNITIAISNASVGQKFIVEITQDGTGSRTVTWFTTIRWVDGTAPTLTTTANKRDTFGFIVTGSGTYDGYVVGQNI